VDPLFGHKEFYLPTQEQNFIWGLQIRYGNNNNFCVLNVITSSGAPGVGDKVNGCMRRLQEKGVAATVQIRIINAGKTISSNIAIPPQQARIAIDTLLSVQDRTKIEPFLHKLEQSVDRESTPLRKDVDAQKTGVEHHLRVDRESTLLREDVDAQKTVIIEQVTEYIDGITEIDTNKKTLKTYLKLAADILSKTGNQTEALSALNEKLPYNLFGNLHYDLIALARIYIHGHNSLKTTFERKNLVTPSQEFIQKTILALFDMTQVGA